MKEITNYFIFIIILSLICGCKPSATQNPTSSNVISYSNITTSKETKSIYYQQDINEISVYNKTEKFEVPPNGGLHSKNEPVIKDKNSAIKKAIEILENEKNKVIGKIKISLLI